ncbi:60S large subunit ribosomal protein P1 [Andalucia godoyi]|uniref:60S large subunit ribosomal protein P1 n=1 Tax=Andalucia godoyi TaxID=505711 RepID=A0A8K0AHK1_ANDGO|nr:60S large subunit ribosomal protein P1 [Andalucia godoyi]|eukprot:ANDGO_00060.mRNA.1 60S large subunit ribosomal protein P1
MSNAELACTYAVLALHDDGIAITADKIKSLLDAAGVKYDAFWPKMFARFCEGRNINDLLTVQAAPAAAAAAPAAAAAAAPAAAAGKDDKKGKKEEKKEEEEDGDMGFGLFD